MSEEFSSLAWRSASAEQLWAVLELIPVRVSFIDRERRHRFANDEYAKVIGQPVEQILGKTVAEVLGEEEDRRLQPFADAALAGETVNWEGWAEIPRGVQRYIHRTYVPHADETGQVVGFFVLVRDTTEHQEAVTEQRRLSRLLEDAIESIPNGFAVYDSSSRLAVCNSAYATLYGAPKEQLLGADIDRLVKRVIENFKTVDGRPVDQAREIYGPNLEELWSDGRTVLEAELEDGRWILISRHEGAEGGQVFVRTDITDLKRMEQALRESERLLRSVLDACPVPVTMTRADNGLILYVSPATSSVYGGNMPAGPDDSIVNYYVDAAARKAYVALLRQRRRVDDYEVQLKRTDGTPFWASVSARLIEYQGEEVIVASTLDLTERRTAEAEMERQREALYQSEKLNALGGLLAGVAHELNNPLSVVVGQASLLSETARDPAVEQRAEQIQKAADRCSRIVKTFLAMARQSTPERSEVDLNDVVDAALEITAYTLQSADIDVSRSLTPDLPPVWADPDQLNQVVMNLIINAEQAMAEQVGQRSLALITEADDDAGLVRLTVRDNGPGIPAELRSRIFDPFFTTKEVGSGTGVGLTVSHGIVQAHNGAIEVAGEPGAGATFVITLPRCSRAPLQAEAAPERETRPAPGRVLIVDDEPDVSEMLSEILSLDGHEVDVASSGNAAMQLIARHRFDVILSDMRMPDVDGPGLYKRIRNAFPDLVDRLVFITGDALGPTIGSFLNETGLPHLEKPVTPSEVREAVQQRMRNRSPAAVE